MCGLCGGGFAPPTQEVGCVVVGVWWNVIVGVLLALFVDRWSVKISWRFVRVLLWVCSGPTLSAQLRSIEYITSPAADIIE